ncbi:S-layer homology domain-containing protein [uncultured Brevibacillus sp.]|uniref:S-layer homology domain-containing protein n=1 Tax=uncultured Brevibacillus sp. TaxID=169970 RepID=UPI002595CAC9|nr:S-layer homology domain-containing protein [uncultured Brevibacillus sp.]
MKRALTLFLSVLMFLTVIPFAGAASPSFSDVPRNHWAYKEITEMAEKGIIKGYDNRTFRPNNEVTRAEFAKIMIAAADVDMDKRSVSQTFKDVPKSHWAFYYVEYAKPYLTGYKSGSTYTYKPDNSAVREDIAVALVRLLGYDKKYKADMNQLKKFRDSDDISPALRSYIAIAIQTDLMKGNNNYFRPQDPITRAEAASLLYRALINRDGDETKVVFPNPEQPKPQPISISDSFSDSNLKNWDTKNADGNWGVINKQVTAVSTDDDLDHFLLPLIWEESANPENYELSVDVTVVGTNGLGGLFFNGKDGKANVVYLTKDRIYLGKVKDVEDDDIDVIASGSYKLKSSNRLKVVVKGSTVSIYINDQYLFGQQQVKQEGTKLGLYLQEDATEDAPRKMTYLDNFSFKEVK